MAGLAIIVGGATVFWQISQARPEVSTSFETKMVGRGAIVSKVTATGSLSALVTVQIGSQVSGRIRELHADFNTEVTKGQVLAQLDAQLFKASVAQAAANYAAATASLARAEALALEADRNAERFDQLARRKLVAAADAESAFASKEVARADVASAKANVLQTKASLTHARVNLGYATIVSPIDGVVVSRDVDVGQTVAASLQAPVLFEIAEDLRRMQVHTSVAEADIGSLQPGIDATFTVDAYPGQVFAGTVRQIRNAASMVQNVVTYDAVIDVANPELMLKPGMTANVTFVVAKRPYSLRVPNAALRFRLPSSAAEADGRRAVYVLSGGRPVRVPVQIGISDGRFTEIVAGALDVGAAVVVGRADDARGARRRSGVPKLL